MSYDKLEDTIQEAYKNVFLFNSIAGNLDNVTPESVDNQLSFVYEELCETIDAVESGMHPEYSYREGFTTPDYNAEVELIDGVCDLFVTVAGLMQKLEVVGFDVSGALKKVNDNNLQKFPPIEFAVIQRPTLYKVTNKKLPDFQPPNTTKESDDRFGVWVFKDIETGKIRKPTNFIPVNLKGHEVVGFLAGGV